jgi:hypothetical protein
MACCCGRGGTGIGTEEVCVSGDGAAAAPNPNAAAHMLDLGGAAGPLVGGAGGGTEFSGKDLITRCRWDDEEALEDNRASDDMGKSSLSEALGCSKMEGLSAAVTFVTGSGVATCKEFPSLGLTLLLAPIDC